MNNHQQREIFFFKERGVLQEDTNNIPYELMLKVWIQNEEGLGEAVH